MIALALCIIAIAMLHITSDLEGISRALERIADHIGDGNGKDEPSEPEQAPRPASSLPPVRPRQFTPTLEPECMVCPTAERCGDTPPEECGVLASRSGRVEKDGSEVTR